MIFDLGWVFNLITGTTNYSAKTASDIYEFAIQGKRIRQATNSNRILRIIRLFKMVRMIKLYKHIHKIMTEVQEW